MLKKVEAFLKTDEADLERKDRNNLRFYLSMFLAMKISNNKKLSVRDVGELDFEKLDGSMMVASLRIVRDIYEGLGGGDRVAKGRDFVDSLKKIDFGDVK